MSKVKWDLQALGRIDSESAKALKKTAEDLLTHIVAEELIPFDTGLLQGSTFVDGVNASKGNVKIVSETPYASAVYFAPYTVFHNTYNVNARFEWWSPYLTGMFSGLPKERYKINLGRGIK